MSAFGFRTRRTRRMWTLGATTALIASAILLVAGSATGTLSGSSFNTTNGDLEDSALHDWNPPRAAGTLSGSDLGNIGPLQTITCGGSTPANCGLDLTNSSSDDSFAQGPKEDDLAPAVGAGSIPPNKDDLSRFYVNKENTATADFLYLAWERTNLLGSAHMDFEFNQSNTNSANGVTKVRQAGDLLFSFDFGGSGQAVLDVRRWVVGTNSPSTDCDSVNSGSNVSCWSKPTDLTSTGAADGSVNGKDVIDRNPPNDPRTLSGSTTLDNKTGLPKTISSTFGEAAINLTAAGIFPRNQCVHFGAASLKSRSSGESFTSTLKDFIAPIPVNISNCGTVIVRKVTVPAGGTGFPFTSNVSTQPADATAASFSLNDTQSKTISNVLQGSYNVTETVANIGNYTLTNINCSAGDVTPTSTSTATGVVSFTIGANETLDCTYTNTKNKNNPDATTAPTVVPQDSATVTGLDTTGVVDGSADQKMTFTLWDNSACSTAGTGHLLYSKQVTVTANIPYKTDNSGDPAVNGGYTITADGTYYWKVVYNGDSRNNGFTKACGAEKVQVDITP
jgi:hypothetical protein